MWAFCLVYLLVCPIFVYLSVRDSQDTEGLYIGVEFGAMHSRVATVKDGKINVLPTELMAQFSPSYIAFTDNGILFGEAAKSYSAVDPKNTVFGIRHLLGRNYSEIESRIEHFPFKVIAKAGRPVIEIQLGNSRKHFTPEDLYGLILKKIKVTAEAYLGAKVSNAVMTIPTSFGEDQRTATRDAGVQAGLHIPRLMLEPTAAGTVHEVGSDYHDEKKFLVISLNAATLDLHVLELDRGVWETLASANGITLDGNVYSAETEWLNNRSLDDKVELEDVENLVAFDLLSTKSTTDHIFRQTLPSVERLLKSLDMKKGEIDDLIMVGTSDHVPKLQPMFEEFLGIKAGNVVDPLNAHAIGATMMARVLFSGDFDDDVPLFLDVCPMSLGIETAAGTITPIIHRNTPIPTRKGKIFAAAANNQSSMTLKVYQGERALARDNTFLGELEFPLTSPLQGVPAVGVWFELDANSILRVIARDLKGRREERVSIPDMMGWEYMDLINSLVMKAEELYEADVVLRQLLPATNAIL
ncbi:hypothetical protein AK830_g2090 [Neonectria ditissima]|uniref:non-chaperonin molecular chaperone ATPase n=1 Tax=Neonectria ditissima TaxID=78410 RepID=A0A0P7BX91_9HYPO|nr:hypothetical protein AK830_g2090 [Neonectria ditissima]